MPGPAAELAQRLAREAEAVCRHYLCNGRRHGRYWLVGDVANTPGRSLYVRLTGPSSGKGAAGKWTDAATGEHGDLLDLIRLNRHLSLDAAMREARAFLGQPRPEPPPRSPAPQGSPEAARRLFGMSHPIPGTRAEVYLRARGITASLDLASLRFHPRCFYRPDPEESGGVRQAWPALIAAVTDLGGTITGVQRTWLDPSGWTKAPVATPRRAMGHLLGHGVRFGTAGDVLAAGEGIETMLSLRSMLPDLPMIAALSANHLAALALPATLRRLYIARDNDRAGRLAAATLCDRAREAGIETRLLRPLYDDVNADLRALGSDALRARLQAQLDPADTERFLCGPDRPDAGG
jgi:Toprim domain